MSDEKIVVNEQPSLSLVEKADNHEERLKKIEAQVAPKDGKRKREGKVSVPGNLLSWARKSPNRAVALIIGFNKVMLPKRAEARDGNWYIDGDKYNPHPYEEMSVFYYKKTPMIIAFSWRLPLVGGRAEEFRIRMEREGKSVEEIRQALAGEGSRLVGDEKDSLLAEALGIKTFGQQTIIRGIEHAEIDKEKKAGGFGWLIWVIVGIGIVYIAMKFFGK